jgi:hypothetical protein
VWKSVEASERECEGSVQVWESSRKRGARGRKEIGEIEKEGERNEEGSERRARERGEKARFFDLFRYLICGKNQSEVDEWMAAIKSCTSD